ncbi:all trans-polyprenyl-diphosphate synthase PDSS2-like [Achroia grisella]|uniref:all trans-polyprenyl-diphosphate synthase PDSS2-like n=1 Tax=Achroia grisella TaxID=688607 RepID=UPI0027D26846|nr:all trans-polyprenyl-diphosphate synthase PDSS2-like [Achroia grisella]
MSVSYAVSRVMRRASPFLFQKRYESTVASLTKDEILLLLRPPSSNWSNIIRDAEKVVGYPTSFMNLRCLLSDEFANLASYLRTLVGSNHLVMQTAKNVLYGDSKNLQPWGLIILLLSKSVKNNSSLPVKRVEEQQRVLAELTEMNRTGHLIHRGIVNVPFAKRSENTDSAIFGNKISLLLGDYLLVTANGMLASLRNSDVSYIISSGLKDLSEGEFFGERDEQNMPLPGKPKSTGEDYQITFDTTSISVEQVIGKAMREWTARTVFNGASLLGRGCQSAMVLNEQSREMQNYAYHFGCHVGLAWQAATELQQLTSDSKDQFCLASAPVLFALEGNPSLYEIIDQSKNDVKDVDYEDLKFHILKTDAIVKTKKLYEDHAKKATAYIESMGENESVDMIKKLVNTF